MPLQFKWIGLIQYQKWSSVTCLMQLAILPWRREGRIYTEYNSFNHSSLRLMIRFSVGERMVIASAVLLYLYFHCIRLTHWAKARRRKRRRLWMVQNNFNVLCIFSCGKDNWNLSLLYSPLYKMIILKARSRWADTKATWLEDAFSVNSVLVIVIINEAFHFRVRTLIAFVTRNYC